MLVSFHELAKLELNEAAEYYESESAALYPTPPASLARRSRCG